MIETEFVGDIFGDENNPRAPSNELILFGAGLGCNQREHSSAVRRPDGHPTVAGLKLGVKGHVESELIYVEPQALILISNEDFNGVDLQMEALSILVGSGPVGRPR
jgi:hypothetical protein